MIVDDIKNIAKTQKVYVSFDMDGVIAEYDISKNDLHKTKTNDYYKIKRPIKTIIHIMKMLFEIQNIEVGILSACHFENQKQDKIEWLKINVPFLKKENIHIISYEKIKFDEKNKYSLKTQYLENLFKNNQYIVFHIDDDVRVIKSMKNSSDINVVHISSLIE